VKSRKGRKKEEGAKKKESIQTAELDRRDQVTATKSWPNFPSKEGSRGRKSGSSTYWNQVHPPCTERQSLNKECGWKGGDRGGLAQWEQFGKRRNKEEETKREREMEEKP
jgi:hypothetical protein